MAVTDYKDKKPEDAKGSGRVEDTPDYIPMPACETLMARLGRKFMKQLPIEAVQMEADFIARTSTGDVAGRKGDWLIRDENGRYAVIKFGTFRDTYRPWRGRRKAKGSKPAYDPEVK
jgi:hypothetical protein